MGIAFVGNAFHIVIMLIEFFPYPLKKKIAGFIFFSSVKFAHN